jgi:uncharacterized protein YgiM (DUF1202 family)
MLVAVSESPFAQGSEIDSYERAVTSQTKADALAFIEEFGSSHLLGDLIESLRPEIAHEVCADLPSGVSSARRACEQLPKVPVAKATVSSTAGTVQSSPAATPTQPIETHPIGGMAPAPATAEAEAVAPQDVTPVVGQSEPAAPRSTTGPATALAGIAQPATTPSTPIKSRPVVYVRPDSGVNILAQANEGSAIVGTASSNAPLTVLGRDRNWLKVLVPDMTERAGWVHTSSLQMDAGGIRVVPATGTPALPVTADSSTTAAPVVQVASNTAPAVVPSAASPNATSAASATAGSVLPLSDLPQTATTPATPIKSRPVVYVTSDSDADILAQAKEGAAIIGTASSNAPLTVLGRDRNWLKVLVPGMTTRAGWVHISRLQMEAGGVKVVPATGTTVPPVTSGGSTTAIPTVQVASNTPLVAVPSATTAPVEEGSVKIAEPGLVVRIWLSSLKSRELAERDWRALQAVYGDLLANLAPTVRQVDLGADKGGTWYRIYAGPLASRDEARALCAKIKTQPPKRNCFVVVE